MAFIFMLLCVAQAAYPPEADLSIVKSAPLEVNPAEIFPYVITVSNPSNTSAPEVVVTDKLPYEVVYLNITVDPTLGINAVNMSGDLIYIRFDEIPANTTGTIVIYVTAPTEVPTTLYNIVNLRYGNDPDPSDNSMTVSTYVLQLGYNQTEAAKSFEDLLHNQSQMLFEFEDLLHTIPSNASENYIFIASFEQLLRSQANLTSSFEDLLTNATNTGWDEEYTLENRTYLLRSYEQMLWEESFLFASFHSKLNDSWISLCNYTAPGHTQDAQTEFIASFEDLLKRQNRLHKSFDLLMSKLEITDHQALINFLAAYENRLRVQANLYRSFYQLLSWKYEDKGPCGAPCTLPSLSVAVSYPGYGMIFSISVTNGGPDPVTLTGLNGTFVSNNPSPPVPPYQYIPVSNNNWTLAGNVITYTAGFSPIAPGQTKVYTLDKMIVPAGNLISTFCASTGCGVSCVGRSDNIV